MERLQELAAERGVHLAGECVLGRVCIKVHACSIVYVRFAEERLQALGASAITTYLVMNATAVTVSRARA